jgi:ABC-2 type transport system ATP-binding protein
MTPPDPVLELHDLSKSYGTKEVLGGVSLALFPGSICSLLGRNGAGKTTAIRMIMGQIRPTAGEVRIFGKDVGLPESHEVWRRVGYLADEPVLYDHLSGREFLHFIGEIYRIPSLGIERLEELFSLLELHPHIDSPIRTYSLGTKKKIAFLAAILHDPDILILDEPTGSMDAVSARAIREILREFRDRGKLVVFSTHGMDEAERISDRISVLHAGCLRFDGTSSELRSRFGADSAEPMEEVFIRLTEEAGNQGSHLSDLQARGRAKFAGDS